jgi:hypothetical protein
MPKTLDELLTDIREFVGTDSTKANDLASALREREKTVAQPLINVGAKLSKKDLGTKITTLETQLAEAKDKLTETESEFAQFKERSPSLRDLEDNEKRKWEPRVKLEKERADKAEQNAKTLRQQVFRDKFSSHLTRPDAAGTHVDNDPLIVRAIVEQYLDRYVQKDDGSEDVLQIDNDTPYDGRTTDDKIAALADAARRKVNAKYLITQTDNGGGVRNSNGNGIAAGLLTQDQIVQNKRNDPAFVGI